MASVCARSIVAYLRRVRTVMSKGLEEFKRLAYENACCRCQYYIDKKCTNKHECIWLDIEKELKALKIIVKKANIRLFEHIGRYYFKTTNNLYEISKEKYDLLKEVLL